ncbi:hypothetical protein [Parafilimonas terrae]|uniref:Uncharacterized protein n=1 Tax=Parafilimonas terrae TaxID=1465490 RepID=A0A1I5VXH4_9BACT|nr:hypothetical protein [Parafilimonas terrae]SFQ12228.1 hypothetical protein SAMN05444277_105249 [Parafilimonas terrae]
MEEKQLTGEESFKLINRMIHEAKGYFYESGLGGIIYGISIFICCVLSWLVESNTMSFPFHPLFLLTPVFFIQAWVQYREEKKKKAKTFTDEVIDYVWTGYFLSVFAALCGNFINAGYIIITIVLLLTAFASFITGMITKFRYHIICGLVCMLIAIVSFFVQSASIYLLMAVTALIVWLVPGLILRARFKKLYHN